MAICRLFASIARPTVLLLALVIPAESWAQSDHRTTIKWNADSLAAQVSPTGSGCSNIRATGGAAFDPTNKAEGLASMKLTYSGTSEGNSGCIDFDTGSNFQVDTSWYNANWICNHWSMKVDPNFQWDLVQGKFKASRWKTSGDQEVADTYMHGGYMSMECPYGNCNITCGGGNDNCFQINYSFRPSVNPAAANWQAYTWAFKEQSAPGASDGQVALWVNGVLIGRVTGARFTDGLSVGPVMMGYSLPGTMMSPYPQAPNGTLWLDDFSQTIGRSECTPHTLSSSGSAPIINTAPPPPVLLP